MHECVTDLLMLFIFLQLDVVTVDLDGGVISVPECVNLPPIPEPYYTSVVEALTKVKTLASIR